MILMELYIASCLHSGLDTADFRLDEAFESNSLFYTLQHGKQEVGSVLISKQDIFIRFRPKKIFFYLYFCYAISI